MDTPFSLLIFIVAYNAQKHIAHVLDRIPDSLWQQAEHRCDVLIIDDASPDSTVAECEAYFAGSGKKAVLQRNAVNQGYGGNQKLGYRYALEHGHDAVVLLHGDGQYDPALIPQLVEPLRMREADVVIGSRMMDRKAALRGGMPRYKFVGNIVLTWLQNRLLGCKLAEFHSGYRVYGTHVLRRIPFALNSNYFDFDTDILIQCIDVGARIREISIPTFYGDEICHVNGIRYAWLILWSTLVSRLQKRGLANNAKFRYTER
jgi:glycosyltransferase involved in cell wall biosynthesis